MFGMIDNTMMISKPFNFLFNCVRNKAMEKCSIT